MNQSLRGSSSVNYDLTKSFDQDISMCAGRGQKAPNGYASLCGAQLAQYLIILSLNIISSICASKRPVNVWRLSYFPTPCDNLNISVNRPILFREQNEGCHGRNML